MRIGIEFSKTGPAKYISHLDLQRAFSRAIRRAGLPVKLSQGFNPHYVMSFASALAVGMDSQCECVEMVTNMEMDTDSFLTTLQKVLPPGICAKRAVKLGDNKPKLMAVVQEAAYTVFFKNTDLSNIKLAVYDIMNKEEIIAVKKTKGKDKTFDMRPMIVSLDLDNKALKMRLVAAPTGSLKPEFVLSELEKRGGGFKFSIERTGLFAYSNGKAIDLLTACMD